MTCKIANQFMGLCETKMSAATIANAILLLMLREWGTYGFDCVLSVMSIIEVEILSGIAN